MSSEKETTGTKPEFKIEKHAVLPSPSGKYQIESFLGEGSFGKVAQCLKLGSNEKMAIKIVSKKDAKYGKREVRMLKHLIGLDLNKHNLVNFIEDFKYRGNICMVFEKLDISLWDLMRWRFSKPLSLSELRVIAQQLLVALDALKSIGLVHTDIKPDNVMLVNERSKSLKLKLIDFGLAYEVSSLKCGTVVQALGFRAPEVILGLPLKEAMDMWGVGCVLAFMYLGTNLHSTQCQYEVIRAIVQLQGQPDNCLLTSGMYTPVFFQKIQDDPPSWRLKTRTEYETTTGNTIIPYGGAGSRCSTLFSVDGMEKMKDPTEFEDKAAFVSIMKRMLHVDYKKRITPKAALGHRFITLKHADTNSPYVTSAHMTIDKCRLEMSSVKYKSFITSSEAMRLGLEYVTKSDDSSSSDESEASLDEVPVPRPITINRRAAEMRPPATNKPAAEKRPPSDKRPATDNRPATAKRPATDKRPLYTNRPAAEKRPPYHKKTAVDKKPAANKSSAAYKRPPADTRPAADNRPPHINKEASPSSMKCNSSPSRRGDEDSSGLVEVKCGKTFFKRVGRFFSRMREHMTVCLRGNTVTPLP
ncbi:homeodomain-interacting protein kinase 3-like [Scomber scombrus]|uniref:Homeodomain-interacting protein kinase 3-like n=1 Tax=Scomber scombrus TaxID=13677 RepID=A0AAV1QBY5_SCOSC